MRWRDRERSKNVEDRRGESAGRRRFPFPRGGGGLPGGGRIPLPTGKGGGLGIVGLLIVLGLMFFFGIDPRVILEGGGGGGISYPQRDGTQEVSRPVSPEQQELAEFVSVTLKTTEEVWTEQFRQMGRTYQVPRLVLFSDIVDSGCGTAVAQMGPFYCPLDGKIYIDLSFYRDLKTRFGAPGDFAQAYVVAHEVGHHVQTLLGITEKIMSARQRVDERQGNAMQVRMELQADCLAGLWAKHAEDTLQIVEPGDIDEALNAAAAIGDDRIQRRTQGQVVPDAFTHGTSAQRVGAFRTGFASGQLNACNMQSLP